MFPDNATAERWFVETRWPNGVACPRCGSTDIVAVKSRKPQPFYCRDCRKHFSVKVGTLMEGSKLGLRVWAIAYYLLATGIKGTAPMKLHRDLGVTQKTAWHLAHRIRETWRDNSEETFSGQVEADDNYIGGKVKNMPNWKRKQHKGRGPAGKVAVAGVKERFTNRVRARVVKSTDGPTLKGFVEGNTEKDATVFTDTARAYSGLPRKRQTVNHTVGQYVDGQAHTNGMESFWSLMKRGYRPHAIVESMNAELLEAWRAAVATDDWIICAGDLALAGALRGSNRLAAVAACPGRQLLVVGNHDLTRRRQASATRIRLTTAYGACLIDRTPVNATRRPVGLGGVVADPPMHV